MKLIKYLDKHGLGTVIALVKKQFRDLPNMYTVKGSAVYADSDFLALTGDGKDLATGSLNSSDITSTGLWQLIDGSWTKISEFREGDAYNIINSFTTDSMFLEGSSNKVEAGSNILVVNKGSENAPEYKWDVMSGIIDFSAYQTKQLLEPVSAFNSIGLEFETLDDLDDFIADPYADSEPDAELGQTGQPVDFDNALALVTNASARDDNGIYLLKLVKEGDTDHLAYEKVGDNVTVEGALSLIANLSANTPISDNEIDKMWSEA